MSKWLEREFLITLASQIIGLGIFIGVITPEHMETANKTIVELGGLAQSIVTAATFAISRGLAKKGA